MTDRRALRNLAGLALIPAAAGVFGASVTWAVGHDPMATTAAAPVPVAAPAPVVAPAPLPVLPDPKVAELTAQVVAAQDRIAQLQVAVDGRVAAAAAAPVAAPAASARAPQAAQAAPAPAPAPAPAVNATTGASG